MSTNKGKPAAAAKGETPRSQPSAAASACAKLPPPAGSFADETAQVDNTNLELIQSKNDLEDLLSNLDIAIVTLGSDLCIRRFTPAAEKMLHFNQTDVGRKITNIKLQFNVSALERMLIDTIQTSNVKELDLQDQNGRWYTMRIRPYSSLDNKLDGVVIVILDVDRHKRAQEYAENIIDSVAEPLLVLDMDLLVRRASRTYYQTFQRNPAQTEKCPIHELGDCEWSGPKLQQAFDALRLHNTPVVDFELSCNYANIGSRAVLLNARKLEHASTRESLILVTIKDITDRKRLEEYLSKRIQELASADRAKNEFLSVLAHELRNPLAPLLNSVSLLKRSEGDEALTKRALGIMDRQIQNLTRLVDDLLDVSRISRGMIQVRKECCDLKAIVARAVDVVCYILEARGQKLSFSLPSESVYVEADPARLEQVFGNLLTNATKFTEQGGHIWIAMECDTRASSPDAASAAGPHAVVRIRDDGMGIAPEMLPHIFEMFKQADPSAARAQGGLGIGLTLVRQLLTLNGGTVSAASAGLGMGSEFEVRLPLFPSPATFTTPPQKTCAESNTGRRILVVDDNVDVAETLAMLLRDADHNVEVVHSGMAALEVAAARPPEVILLDIGLPGFDGYQVARKMRELPGMKKAVLIALTGYGQEEDRKHAEDAGFDAHLTKPTTLKAIEESIARVCSQ